MKPAIWTTKTRTMLYERLVQLFGPYTSWKENGIESSDDYKQFCAAFATAIGASPKHGVECQVRWAVTRQASTDSQGYTTNLWGNKIAAYEGGFIPRSYLPSETLVQY